jgi:hypothetical protein
MLAPHADLYFDSWRSLVTSDVVRREPLSELPVEDAPAVAEAAHEAAGGKVVYITEGGQRLAARSPPTTPPTWLKISPTQKLPARRLPRRATTSRGRRSGPKLGCSSVVYRVEWRPRARKLLGAG